MNTPSKQVAPRAKDKAPSLVEVYATKFQVEPEKMLATLRATAFRTGKNEPPVTNEEMMGLLIVASQYNLNPWLKEIYAFRNKHTGGITAVVGYDGWIKLVQSQPTYAGEEFSSGYSDELNQHGKARGFYYECAMYRKDRPRPTVVREYLNENIRDTDPWRTMENRMLRMRAYIQSARVCFGFGGIYDVDEGEAISLSPGVDLLPLSAKSGTKAPEAKAAAEPLLANPDQIEAIKERLAVTGLPDNVLLAKFEVGDFPELRADQVAAALTFIQDNAP